MARAFALETLSEMTEQTLMATVRSRRVAGFVDLAHPPAPSGRAMISVRPETGLLLGA